ncbi:uncharacterized protein LOC111083868 [Limulus polyphemus]|uniref:Uncharacterized protein LOC111083868 n=1 Tax=Limulus polyphemus TaxID=6850 RepID=A0ABM1RY34_LIMPO|nr:uncharacterized protein LOC111083868 [Limulus polyphemus]
MVIMPILLLNMLIAMMGNTYCEVITQSQKEWVKQWAKIVVALEKGISQKKAKEFMQSYSIRFGAPSGEDGSERELRAVMVIKNKPKSKARQRKGAICNWKRMGKSVIQELRQSGVTAASLKQRFNSLRNSIANLPVCNQSDNDSEDEIKKGNGFVSALNQLTFSRDLKMAVDTTSNNSGSPPKEANFSFGDTFNQLTRNQDLEVGKSQTPPKGESRERAPTEFNTQFLEKKERIKFGIINEGFVPSGKNPRFLPALNEDQSSGNRDLEDDRGSRYTTKAPISQGLQICVHHHKKYDRHKKKTHKKYFRNRAKVGIGTEHCGEVKSKNKLENANLMNSSKSKVPTEVKEVSKINPLVRENGNALTKMNETDSDDSWNKTVEAKRSCSHHKLRHKKRRAKSALNALRSREQCQQFHGTSWNSERNSQPAQDHNEQQLIESFKSPNLRDTLPYH